MKSSKRLIVIGVLLMVATAIMGGNNYRVLYDELVVRITGEGVIDWEALAAICGWAGKPNPGETVWEYRVRTSWDMFSTKMAMAVLITILFASFYGIVRFVFWITEKRE